MSDIKTTVPFRHDIDSSSMRGWTSDGEFVGEQTAEPATSKKAVPARRETYTESMAGVQAFVAK